MKRFFNIILVTLISMLPVRAQRTFWYSADQLSNTMIHSICNDSQGFLWIGTEYGLNRFDGYSFSYFFNEKDNVNSLMDNYIFCTEKLSDGKILLGTSSGLQLLNPLNCSFSEGTGIDIPHDFIYDIVSQNDSTCIIATGSNGLFSYKTKTGLTEHLDNLNSAMSGNTRTLFNDSHGRLWLGTTSGLYMNDPSSGITRRISSDVLASHVTGIEADASGNIFISTQFKVFRWNDADDSLTPVETGTLLNDITHMFIDNLGQPIITVRGDGMRHYDPETDSFIRMQIKNSRIDIDHQDVSILYQDERQNTWLGCFNNGLMMLPAMESQFHLLDPSNYGDLVSSGITSILADNSGNIWTAFSNNGISCFSRDGRLRYSFSDRPYANSLELSGHGTIYAGLFRGGIVEINPGNGSVITSFASDERSPVSAILDGTDGTVYYGTVGHGCFALDKVSRQNRRLDVSDGDEHLFRMVSSLALENDSLLWIGLYSGLMCLDLKSGAFMTDCPVIQKTGNARCNSMIIDHNGILWVATGIGLFKYDRLQNYCVIYDSHSGLSNSSVQAVIEDADGNIWCSTRMGLNRIDSETGIIDCFYSGGGLQEKDFNSRASTISLMTGDLYFASPKGITWFNPDEVSSSDIVGKVVLTSFYLNNVPVTESTLSGKHHIVRQPVSSASEFRLSSTDNSFTLEFSTMDYSETDGIRYDYSFGSSQWTSTPAGTNRISFTRLAPGRHTLSVRACLNNSYSPVSQYIIKVDAPWYAQPLAIFVYCLIFSGAIVLYVYVSRKRQQQNLADAKLQSFINIAHEICSPMTMLISPLEEMMSRSGIDDDSRKSLQQMHRSSTRILNLVNQLLDLRRYDEGQMHLKCRQTDIVSFLQGTFEMYIYQSQQRSINYTYSHKADEIPVWIDRDSIEKVVTNLLSNAFKYTPDEGSITLSITTGSDESVPGPLGRYCEVRVTDTGIGLDPALAERIFDRFYRAQNNSTAVTLGMGIGLNYCRILVNMHKGRIWAENRQECQGSSFVFRIPLGKEHISESDLAPEQDIQVKVEPAYTLPEPIVEPRAKKQRGVYKILIVDDDDAMLDFIRQNLSQSYTIYTSNNGKEGHKMAISKKPDLIVSDVVMPEMDGMAFVKTLKSNTETSHIPVILLSARRELQDRMAGLDNGADAYLAKPFYVSELKSLIHNLINNRLILKGKFSGEQQQKDKIENVELKSSDEQLMNRIMELVNANLSNSEFNIEDIVETLGISRTHLHRKLKEMTGLSAGKFILNLRLQQAAKLLEENGMNITQIAYAVGFTSQTHFSTIFKNYYGVTPSEYAEQHSPEVDVRS